MKQPYINNIVVKENIAKCFFKNFEFFSFTIL